MSKTKTMDQRLLDMLAEVYDSEINWQLASFWDDGYAVWLGDEANGFVEEWQADTLPKALWRLPAAIERHYPNSDFMKRRAPDDE